MMANLIAARIDDRILFLVEKLNRKNHMLHLTYSRYADDLTFSYNDENLNPDTLISYAEEIMESEGFLMNLSKVQIFTNSEQQRVTGIVVNNSELSIGRGVYRKWRAILHSIRTKGWEAAFLVWNRKHRKKKEKARDIDHFKLIVQGYASYISMVNREGSHARYLRDFSTLNFAVNFPATPDNGNLNDIAEVLF